MTEPDDDVAHARLVAQYNEIAALAGALAHEIKNPLSTIRLNMDLLGEDFAAAETARDRRALIKIEVVQRECQRLEDLLNNFLNFARPQTLRLQPTDLNAEIERLIDFFRDRARESGVEVITYLDPDLPSVQLDREAFQSALVNLMLNAQQALPKGGQIVIRTKSGSLGVILELIDTGVGMDSKTLGQIFQAFFSTKPGGSGLGLPTARKIIEAHGGRMRVESELGRGTQFTISLPVPPRLTAR